MFTNEDRAEAFQAQIKGFWNCGGSKSISHHGNITQLKQLFFFLFSSAAQPGLAGIMYNTRIPLWLHNIQKKHVVVISTLSFVTDHFMLKLQKVKSIKGHLSLWNYKVYCSHLQGCLETFTRQKKNYLENVCCSVFAYTDKNMIFQCFVIKANESV